MTATAEADNRAPEEFAKPERQVRGVSAEESRPLEAETIDDVADDDSALGDDAASSTASMRSSILQYRSENGRTYHSFKESNLQHHLFMLTLNGHLFLCPAGKNKPMQRCLDAGTGTGVWAIDLADEHPETEVIGIDLSPIQPTFLPSNLSFQVDDLEDQWTYSYKFDLIFARMLVGSIGDWPKFFQQSFDALGPGGWVECQDIAFPVECDDGTLDKDSPIDQWSSFMIEATNVFGRSAQSAKQYKQQMIDAGFVNVTEVIYKWPTNRWPADPYFKELGVLPSWNHMGDAG
ncbi:hypothetical protein ACJ41O_000214 [Fusarium nematophilum]